MKNINSTVKLSNGVDMHYLGFGTFKVSNDSSVITSVKEALRAGYRHIDTAAAYENEEGVGLGIKQSGIPRNEIFLVSKVQNSDQGYDSTLKAFETTLKKLQTSYLDLYLIHWPSELCSETWKALEKLYNYGKVRAIGICNFTENHLKKLFDTAKIIPMVNQVEFHPALTQAKLINFCNKNTIQVEAWSPLMRGEIFKYPILNKMAEKYGKSAAQIVLRWDLQLNVITIPKSTTPHRIKENSDIFDFDITDEDMNKISSLNADKHVGPDPNDIIY